MMKALRFLLLVFSLLIGVAAGLWAFFPWDQAVQVAFDEAAREAGRRGTELSALEVSGSGGLKPLFRVRGLSMRHSLFTANAALVEARLSPFKSLLARSIVMDLSLGAGDLLLLQGHRLSWRNGFLHLVAGPGTFDVSRLDMTGDLTVKGGFSIDPSTSRLTGAALDIRVPAEMDSVLAGLQALLPIRKEGEGRWKVERP